MDLVLRQLQYLVALAKYGHFGRAAEACRVSQPTLSAAIHQLEQELGTSLVMRGHRFQGLTHDGDVVLQWSRRILADCEAMRDQLDEQPEGISGRLRISGVPSALPVITMLTTPLANRHPRATIETLERAEEEALNDLVSFETDVALVYRDMVGEEKFHVSRSLFIERYVFLTPVDGPLSDKVTVTWEEVAAIPLCLPSKHMRNRQIIDGFLHTDSGRAVQIEANSLMSLCAHVCSGSWSTVMPHAFLYPFGAPQGTKAIAIDGPKGTQELCLATRQVSPLPPLVREFFQIANETDMVKEIRAALGLPLNQPYSIRPPSPVVPARDIRRALR
jgi:DNA-binding transcriptional LysR family regulator